MRLERDSTAFKHQNEMKRLGSQNLTKMLVSSAMCFILGVAAAITFIGGVTPEVSGK